MQVRAANPWPWVQVQLCYQREKLLYDQPQQHFALQIRTLFLHQIPFPASPNFISQASSLSHPTHSMTFTKFYRRRLAILAVISLCFLLSFMNSLFKHISDDSLEAVVIELQTKSNFNPRAITYALFSYIDSNSYSRDTDDLGLALLLSNDSGINFHWDDWVDLSPGNTYLDRARKAQPSGSCGSGLTKFSQVNPYFMESYNTKINRGMANLYCVKDIPKRILVSTDNGFIEVPVTGNRRLGLEELSYEISKQKVEKMVNKVTANKRANVKNEDDFKFLPYLPLRKSVDVSPQDFVFDIDKEIMALKELLAADVISPEDKDHLKFLEASNSIVDSADRFFKYPWIYSDVVAGRSHHTSFPFFKRFISSKERQSVIQHMVRAWFTFSEASGVDSWVNYGSLLGWAYNGVNLPWDTDVDIQIPIAQLDKLSKRFNSTIITENPKHGNAKYLFEVSPTYTRQGNGRNFIDARFIEINTGLYIDISVLAHTTDQPPKSLLASLTEDEKLRSMPVHCKNWNWHLLDELLPIRQTLFESSPVYIPHNISSILSRKYGQDSFTSKLHFNGYHYDQQLLLWIPDKEDVRDCVLESKAYGKFKLSDDCRSDWVKDEFNIIHQAAENHKKFDFDINYSSATETADYPVLPLTRKDSFEYFSDIIERRVSNTNWFKEQN